MKKTTKLFVSTTAAAILVTVLPTTPSVTASTTDDLGTTTTTTGPRCWEYSASEQAFVEKMNSARRSTGVGQMTLDKELSRVARKHSKEMIESSNLYHTPDRLLTSRVTRWNILGENVGVGGSVDSLHSAFMNSPAHKANIVYTPFKHVGVGVKEGDGRMWVTVIFQASADPGTTLWMPKC